MLLLVTIVGMVAPGGDDWWGVFQPATRLLVAGDSPYAEPGFYSPAWTLLPFVPLLLLPDTIARGVLFSLGLLTLTFSAKRLGAGRAGMIFFLLSPPVVFSLWLGSLDWMPLLGFTLPPQIGLFLVLAKPQMGGVVALYWLIEAWRKGGWREAARVFAPCTTALLLTFVLYGLWPMQSAGLAAIEHNASLWPFSIALGLPLAAAAFFRRRFEFAIAATPFLSPYVMFTSWSGVLAALFRKRVLLALVSLGLWGLVFFQASKIA
jgi:hypothetical protein